MKRTAIGVAMGLALAVLLGAAGDEALEKRVKSLETQIVVYQNQIGRANSRVDALETRVKALESKVGVGGAVAPAGENKPVTDPAAGDDPATGDLPAIDDSGGDAKERAYKLKIRGLTTKGYLEVDGPAGIKDVWVAPITTRPGPKNDVESTGQMRYIGEEDLSEYDLTFKVVYRDIKDNPVGYAEFKVAGKLLKDDRDYVFRTPVTLSGRAANKPPEIHLMKKEPASKSGSSTIHHY
ncbi:MAG: hypothetical protein BIFFINMI_00374 [Phycisphaerae bacterium]|nr:hypothetical protein [Phycisphaerae bacterium]